MSFCSTVSRTLQPSIEGILEKAEFGIVGGRLPILAAEVRRAGAFGEWLSPRGVGAGYVYLHVLGRIVVERQPSFGVQAACPVELVDILFAGHERSVGTVESIEEAVAGRMDHELAILAVDLGIDDRVLGDFIVVVGIVGSILETPFDF